MNDPLRIAAEDAVQALRHLLKYHIDMAGSGEALAAKTRLEMALAHAAIEAPTTAASATMAEIQDWLEHKRHEANRRGDHKTQFIIKTLSRAITQPTPPAEVTPAAPDALAVEIACIIAANKQSGAHRAAELLLQHFHISRREASPG